MVNVVRRGIEGKVVAAIDGRLVVAPPDRIAAQSKSFWAISSWLARVYRSPSTGSSFEARLEWS
jgi:hypothetical protein